MRKRDNTNDGFQGAWLHFNSGGQDHDSVFSCATHRQGTSSPSLVPEDKRSCFSQGERFAVQLPLDRMIALQN